MRNWRLHRLCKGRRRGGRESRKRRRGGRLGTDAELLGRLGADFLPESSSRALPMLEEPPALRHLRGIRMWGNAESSAGSRG